MPVSHLNLQKVFSLGMHFSVFASFQCKYHGNHSSTNEGRLLHVEVFFFWRPCSVRCQRKKNIRLLLREITFKLFTCFREDLITKQRVGSLQGRVLLLYLVPCFFARSAPKWGSMRNKNGQNKKRDVGLIEQIGEAVNNGLFSPINR